jgi:hypothetical protein
MVFSLGRIKPYLWSSGGARNRHVAPRTPEKQTEREQSETLKNNGLRWLKKRWLPPTPGGIREMPAIRTSASHCSSR